MSFYGCVFLTLCVLSALLGMGDTLPGQWETIAKGTTALFGILFVISLVVGRRIKFDPILR